MIASEPFLPAWPPLEVSRSEPHKSPLPRPLVIILKSLAIVNGLWRFRDITELTRRCFRRDAFKPDAHLTVIQMLWLRGTFSSPQPSFYLVGCMGKGEGQVEGEGGGCCVMVPGLHLCRHGGR